MEAKTKEFLDSIELPEHAKLLGTLLMEAAKALDNNVTAGLLTEYRRIYAEIMKTLRTEDEEDELDSILDE